MLACLVYAYTSGSFHRLHSTNQYQNRFLAAGGLIAVLLSLLEPTSIKTWLPGMLTAALLLSAICHKLYPQWRIDLAEAPDDTSRNLQDTEKQGEMKSQQANEVVDADECLADPKV